jgi:hypothetical protein
MLSSTTIALLFLTIVLMQSPSVPQSQEECQAAVPSRNSLEEILGTPVKCFHETADVCYRGNSVRVHFDSSNRAETIFLGDSCSGVAGLAELMNKLVPKDIRGESLKEPLKQPIILSTSCHERSYVEEYGCLNIEYFEGSNCMDCNHGFVKIRWK